MQRSPTLRKWKYHFVVVFGICGWVGAVFSIGYLKKVFFIKIFPVEKLIYLKNAGMKAGVGNFGCEVAAF
jgi:hypothetical protein